MTRQITTIRTLTPTRVGTGQSLGIVDLPVAREKATNWPVLPGSSVKGVLKAAATDHWLRDQANVEAIRNTRDEERHMTAYRALAKIFGSDDNDNPAAGSLQVTDQRLLLFPVRSFFGTFAYATCPLALERFADLEKLAGQQPEWRTNNLNVEWTEAPTCKVHTQTSLRANNGTVYLEDLNLSSSQVDLSQLAARLAQRTGLTNDHIAKRLVILDDTTFSFLAETATEIVFRTALEYHTKTVREGSLRAEEAVPPEAVFCGLAIFQNSDTMDLNTYAQPFLQFGGKASTGSGICSLVVN